MAVHVGSCQFRLLFSLLPIFLNVALKQLMHVQFFLKEIRLGKHPVVVHDRTFTTQIMILGSFT